MMCSFKPVKLEDPNSYNALMGCPFCEERLVYARDFRKANPGEYYVDFRCTCGFHDKVVCPDCGSELEYDRYVGFMNGEAYLEYDCSNSDCGFTGRVYAGNIHD